MKSRGPSIVRPGPPPLGRTAELEQLNQVVRVDGKRVVAISGVRGIGKTTLGLEIFAYHRDQGISFDDTHAIAGHGKPAAVLLDDLYRRAAAAVIGSQRPEDLPRLIIESLIDDPGHGALYFVDNVEDETALDHRFLDLIRRWAEADTSSTLLFTSRETVQVGGEPDDVAGFFNLELGRLSDPKATLALVGDTLRRRFGERAILSAAEILGNVPQHLLYLRWAQPESIDEFLAQFAGREEDAATISSLRAVLDRRDGAWFLTAVGVLRTVHYQFELLTHLWSHLTDRDQSELEQLLGYLTENRILIETGASELPYRVHPSVHIDLRRLAEERGRRWLHDIHLAAADFYETTAAVDGMDIRSRAELVHHYITLNDFPKAYAAVLAGSDLSRWRNGGLSLRVEPVLEQLVAANATPTAAFTIEQQGLLHLALANVCSDLGQPNTCLEHLNNASDSLQDAAATPKLVRLRREIWMQMAISHANLGNTDQCMDYYLKVINDDPEIEDVSTALCMGYLGYEYCDHRDFRRADEWTRLALERCGPDRDLDVFAKNLSNRALVFFFKGELEPARTHFEQAEALVGRPGSGAADVREHGRVLANLGLTYLAIATVPLQQVRKTLESALRLTRRAGDARRVGLSLSRLGLLEVAEENFGLGARLILQGMEAHKQLGDNRNLVFGLLNYIGARWIRVEGSGPPDARKIISWSETQRLPREIEGVLPMLDEPKWGYLLESWSDCYRPRSFRI